MQKNPRQELSSELNQLIAECLKDIQAQYAKDQISFRTYKIGMDRLRKIREKIQEILENDE